LSTLKLVTSDTKGVFKGTFFLAHSLYLLADTIQAALAALEVEGAMTHTTSNAVVTPADIEVRVEHAIGDSLIDTSQVTAEADATMTGGTSNAVAKTPDNEVRLGQGRQATSRSSTDTSQAKDTSTETCRFLGLAAELRNKIYEYAFTTPADADEEEIDLLESPDHVPSKSLLLACRKIHEEAAGIYKDSFRRYWTEGNFVVEVAGAYNFRKYISELSFDGLDHITKATLTHTYESEYGGGMSKGGWAYNGGNAWKFQEVETRKNARDGEATKIADGPMDLRLFSTEGDKR
jgi:hypothetical protein